MSTVTLESRPTATGLIQLTPAALKKARELMAKQPNPDQLYLRMGVKGGGCSGYSYVLDLDADVDEKYDRFFEFEDVRVVVDRKSLLLLAGTTLDFSGDLLGQGFTFQNPNVKRGCGCGTSFQV